MLKPRKRLRAEPEIEVKGRITDAPFHEEMLESEEGRDASDLAAFRLARKLGYAAENAARDFVSSPSLRKRLLRGGY